MKFPYTHIYFIGIGGIGMSALAAFFREKGLYVAGYDRQKSAITEMLTQKGVVIHYADDRAEIPEAIRKNPKQVLIVRTPAVSDRALIYTYFVERGYTIRKRAEVLGELTQNMRCLAIAGTHGKTTSSTLLAYLLKSTGRDINAFLGGISANYQSNYISGSENTVVVEADEFDRSFLQLHPAAAVITSMDADHLDIYGDYDMFCEGFRQFALQCRVNGRLGIKAGLPLQADFTYALEEDADYSGKNVRVENGQYHFDLYHPGGVIRDLRCGLPGRHNVENAIAASALALLEGVKAEDLRMGLATFSGVKRRFDVHIQGEVSYIDDYAHHPRELDVLLKSVRELYPGKTLNLIFQPHLYSRTRDFMDEFADVLGNADRLFLLPIYPAREEPISGINSEELLQKIPNQKGELLQKNELISALESIRNGVLVTAGAGDIDAFVEPIKEFYGKMA